MHEISLATNVLEIAEGVRRSNQAHQITGIELEIGQLSSVEPDAMRFAMEALLPDSTASGARVDYQFVAGRARCRKRGIEFGLDFLYDPCPDCESFDKEILAGEELLIKSIKVI